jgi:hypothetical protein
MEQRWNVIDRYIPLELNHYGRVRTNFLLAVRSCRTTFPARSVFRCTAISCMGCVPVTTPCDVVVGERKFCSIECFQLCDSLRQVRENVFAVVSWIHSFKGFHSGAREIRRSYLKKTQRNESLVQLR